MKVYFDIITNHTADVIGYEEGARQPYVSKDVEPYRTAAGAAFDDRDYAGTSTSRALDPTTSFPYTPVLDPAEQNLKVPAWLNDVTLYHNRGDTTFVGENSLYGDFFGLDDLFTENPRVVARHDRHLQDVDPRLRRRRLPHRHDEARQRRVLAGSSARRCCSSPTSRASASSSCSARSSTRRKNFTSHFTTTDRMQSVLDFPFQDAARNFASRGTDPRRAGDFFADDDWYTDADSNVYQLPTFLGNHDMGRIGYFIQADNPGAGDAEWLARDRLAHELMYFSRGNPVIYYGDEQGFTGSGGDQVARQTMFASQVPDYLDDDLLGTDATHAQDNFVPTHPLYRTIAALAALTRGTPGAARRRAAAPVRGRRRRASTRSPASTARSSASTSSR